MLLNLGGNAMRQHVQSAIAMLTSSCGLVTTCFEGKQLDIGTEASTCPQDILPLRRRLNRIVPMRRLFALALSALLVFGLRPSPKQMLQV